MRTFTQMGSLQEIKLTTYCEKETHRFDRLHRVIGYVECVSEFMQTPLLKNVVSMHDHKGMLVVKWATTPGEIEHKAFENAWASAIGDGTTDMVEHVNPAGLPY